jgi:hypothetical protein
MAGWRRYCCGDTAFVFNFKRFTQVVSGPLPPLFVLRSCGRHASNPLSLSQARFDYCIVLSYCPVQGREAHLGPTCRIQVSPMHSFSLKISLVQTSNPDPQPLAHGPAPLESRLDILGTQSCMWHAITRRLSLLQLSDSAL